MIKELYEQWKQLLPEYKRVIELYKRQLNPEEYNQEICRQLIDEKNALANRMKEIESRIQNIIGDKIYEIEEGKFIIYDEEDGYFRILEEYKDDQTMAYRSIQHIKDIFLS